MSVKKFCRIDGILSQSDSDSESEELHADPSDPKEDASLLDDDGLSTGGSPPSDSGTPPAKLLRTLSALAVGSYQNFRQFLSALGVIFNPGNTPGGPNTTPRGPPSALSSAQAASDRVAAFTSRATQQAGPSHIPAGGTGEFSSPGSTAVCADSYFGASTTNEVQRTEGGQVLAASPENPDASSALAVGSYQNFSQYLAAGIYPDVQRTNGGRVLASPENPDASSALAVGSYQNFSQYLAAGIYPDPPSASRGGQAEDSRLQQRLLEMGFKPASIEKARALLKIAGRPQDDLDAIVDILLQLDL